MPPREERLDGLPPRLGGYDVLFPIGSGAMATVLAGVRRGEGGFRRPVALKVMRPEYAGTEQFTTMFLDEARIASQVVSPNVVQTIELGREADTLYIVMDLVIGVSLATLLQAMTELEALVPLPIALSILLETANGLHDAHETLGVDGQPIELVHRDISPQNILLGDDGRVRIADFGIARALERLTQTATGELKGKLAYLAPEQRLGGEVDRRADVYALGLVGWSLLTGERVEDHRSAAAFLHSPSPSLPPIEELAPDVPRSIARVVTQAMKGDRRKRTPSAAAFAEALRQAREHEGIPRAAADALGAFIRAQVPEPLEQIRRGLRESRRESEKPARRRPASRSRSTAMADDAPSTVRPPRRGRPEPAPHDVTPLAPELPTSTAVDDDDAPTDVSSSPPAAISTLTPDSSE